MNLFGFNISISRAAVSPAQKGLALTPEEWLRGEDVAGSPMLANAYEQVVWVYRAINVLAEQVANVPFVISAGDRGSEDLITSGPLRDFYERPHPQINRFQYWELRIIWLMLRGECFRIPIYRNRDGSSSTLCTPDSQLKSVLILDPARFQHLVEDHELIGWRYTGFGPQAPLGSQVFLPEEVWFEKLPNPFDFWRGLSPLSIAGAAASTDFAAGAFMRGVIENNADTGLIVRTEQWLSDEQREQIRSALRDRKRRAGQADRPVLLLGSSEVIKPELSSSDLQFLENRKFSRAEICAAFGVPEEIVTTTDHNKYDVMSGARLNFIENRVAPLCRRLEAEENATTIPALVGSTTPGSAGILAGSSIQNQNSKINNVVGWFDLDSLPILQEARRNRLAAARTAFEMGIPFNELNRVLDLGFKSLPWGDRGYVGSKLQEVREETRNTNESPLENSSDTPASTAAAQSLARTVSLATDNRLATDLLSTDPLKCASHLLSSLNCYQPSAIHQQLLGKVRRFVFEQRGRALAALKQVDCAKPLPTLLDPKREADQLFIALKSPVTTNGNTASLPENIDTVLDSLNAEALASLGQTLAHGQASNESVEQLAARVRALYNELAHEVPERVARALECPLINTGLQPGEPTVQDPAAVSTAYQNSEKPLKRLSSLAVDHTGLKPGVNQKASERVPS